MKTNEKNIYNAYAELQDLSERSSDPTREDIKEFDNFEGALEYANGLNLTPGWFSAVDKVTIDEDGDVVDCETVHYSHVCTGNNINGAVIVRWSWQTYIGYCRKFHGVRFGGAYETESDLIDDAPERVYAVVEEVLLTAEEIAGLTDEDRDSKIYDALQATSWKWEWKTGIPTSFEDYL